MTNIIGCDWASVDGNNTPNFTAARAAGMRFGVIRGTYGRGFGGAGYADPTWRRDCDALRASGTTVGAYLFLCYPTDGDPAPPVPETQADLFAANVGLTSFRDLPPFVDCEEASTLSPADYYDWTLRCVNRLRRNYGGVWPGIYTSRRVWTESFGDVSPGALIDCPLWVAKPWPLQPRSTIDLGGAAAYAPEVPDHWGDGNWWLYQYQGDALRWPGFNSTVDASRFNVTRQGDSGGHVAAAVTALQRTYAIQPSGMVDVETFAAAAWHA
jgi:hypothetical protein